MICACHGSRMPPVPDCQAAAQLVGLDADVAQLADGFQTLVGEASRVELTAGARLRLGLARLLLVDAPRLVLIDDADRFLAAVPRFPGERACVGAAGVGGGRRAKAHARPCHALPVSVHSVRACVCGRSAAC